jgi:hypothetical protein
MFKMEGIMKNRLGITLLLIAGLLLGTTSSVAAPNATPLSNAFTYQGRLDRDGQPYTGSCDFVFRLWAAETDGLEIGSASQLDDLPVSDGLFTAEVDFGSGAFNGESRWLEVTVICPGDTGLTSFPRQELTAAPYALYAAAAPWSGLMDRPAGLDDGDNDTTYSAGDGLTLSTNTFSIDPGYTQRRLVGWCGDGWNLQYIQEDGTVDCQADAPLNRPVAPLSNLVASPDTEGIMGASPSITISPYGLGLISYWDGSNYDLKVAACGDPSCSSATLSTIDATGNVGEFSSIAIGADWLGLISYYESGTAQNLKVAHCDDFECTSAATSIIDSTGNVGTHTSIAIGSDGLGLISYQDANNGDLKIAHCSDPACSSADTINTIDSVGMVGSFSSITIGADGMGLISYYDQTNGDLKVAHCGDLNCLPFMLGITTLDTAGAVGSGTSITTGSDGLGLISYYDLTNTDLKLAHCSNIACTSATLTTLDSTNNVGLKSSITIGPDGLGLISYYDDTNDDLKVAHCNDTICSSASYYTLDSSGNVGSYNTITIGVDGLGLIAYFDLTNFDLKVAKCSSVFCIPYFRRR